MHLTMPFSVRAAAFVTPMQLHAPPLNVCIFYFDLNLNGPSIFSINLISYIFIFVTLQLYLCSIVSDLVLLHRVPPLDLLSFKFEILFSQISKEHLLTCSVCLYLHFSFVHDETSVCLYN